ncbi:MAG TPA: cytochrome c [Candidatus Acidoferrum sp.]|jgi:mono/diheme cytochrome c family protein|nr:cytochrome c [Candidatus Acidoferrum sp.]
MQSKPIAFLAAGAIAAMIAAGCSKGSDQSSSSSSTTTTSSSAPATTGAMAASSAAPAAGGAAGGAAGAGDATHGKQIFMANCASCHGANAEGGVGPSLKGEKSRKNYQQAIAWIKNPQPPMPKLYPSPLSEKDVDDVAAYVETL